MPFNALKYLIGECNYGGRVTEKQDRRIFRALLEEFIEKHVLDTENYCILNRKEYLIPDGNQAYLTYVE